MKRFLTSFTCAFLITSAAFADCNQKCDNGTAFCLFTSIQCNNYDSVLENLKRGASLEAKAKRKTVFEWALNNVNNTRSGRIFNLLHKRGMNIHVPLSGGESSITYAINVLNDTDLADFLLKRGIDIDLKDADGRTALRRVVLDEDTDLAKRFMEYKNNKGAMRKTLNEKQRQIDYLLEKGADISVKAASGEPLFAEVWLKRKDPELALKLLNKTETLSEKTMKNGDFLLLKAIENGNDDILNRLTELGATVNDKNSKGQTPLMVAAAKKASKTVSKLLDMKADPTAKDKNGKSVLMYLIESGNLSAIDKILSSRPDFDINKRTKNGETLLMLAVKSGNAKLVKRFLDRGAKVNLADNNGQTAFMIALDSGKKPIIDLFLSGKEPVNSTNKYGQSTLMLFAKGDDLQSFEKMLKNNPDLKKRDANGHSVVWYAAQGKDFSTVMKKLNLLQTYGADLSQKVDNDLYVTDIIRSRSSIADPEYWTLLKKIHNGGL